MNIYDNFALAVSEYGKEKIDLYLNEPMKNHTSFKIGGAAAAFALPRSAEALHYVYKAAKNAGMRVYILGKGTNVLFDDAGFDGVVISTLNLNFHFEDEDTLNLGAGYSFTAAAKLALKHSFCGLSFAYGIPGSVGGAVYMNAGAYNGQVSSVLSESRYLDLNDGSVHTINAEEHDFGYRHSSYAEHPERVILSASFKLNHGDREVIKSEMEDFMSRRRAKQPLEFPSAGSTFKRYPGRYTGQMIEELGLKGTSVGGAEISEKHAGFIINRNNASSSDVLELIALVKEKIKKSYGIDIECEVIHVK